MFRVDVANGSSLVVGHNSYSTFALQVSWNFECRKFGVFKKNSGHNGSNLIYLVWKHCTIKSWFELTHNEWSTVCDIEGGSLTMASDSTLSVSENIAGYFIIMYVALENHLPTEETLWRSQVSLSLFLNDLTDLSHVESDHSNQIIKKYKLDADSR